jgi:hypothetical protein
VHCTVCPFSSQLTLVPNYTAWWQRHIRVNSLPKVITWWQLLRAGFELVILQSLIRPASNNATAPSNGLHLGFLGEGVIGFFSAMALEYCTGRFLAAQARVYSYYWPGPPNTLPLICIITKAKGSRFLLGNSSPLPVLQPVTPVTGASRLLKQLVTRVLFRRLMMKVLVRNDMGHLHAA